MFDMIGGVGMGMGVEGLLGEWGLRVDTALEHEIFITLRIGRKSAPCPYRYLT